MKTRPAAVAGSFYPSDPDRLADLVDSYLARPHATGPVPKALIVPHAGYIFSGAVAGAGYAELEPVVADLRRVVLAGPAHTVGFEGIAVTGATQWETPLGTVEVDTELRDRIRNLAGVVVDDRPHEAEHCLEVHLPFLQRLLEPDFTILPLVVGWADTPTVAATLDAVWGGNETVVIVSSDLSHYDDYESARRRDAATAADIVAGKGEAIEPERACGALAIAGLLEHELVGRKVELCNSGDTAGDRMRVVGYGAFAFTEA